MGVQLLDKTRKINKLLHNNNSSKVVFNDICQVLTGVLDSDILVISKKGKVLGSSICKGVDELHELIVDEVGGYIDTELNERLLGILSTKENVNLETLGFGEDTRMYKAIITPIDIAGERLGTLFEYRSDREYDIDDIILTEYGTTVVGLEMMRSVNEENEEEKRKVAIVRSAINTLSYSELEAILHIFDELDGNEGILVASRIADRVGITHIPMMYIGVSPFIAATLSVVIITLITFILLADFQKKSIGAMLGTIAGVVVSGLIALVFGHFGHVTGYNVDDIENLIYVGQNSKLDIGGMLFSGILIASLGAVMDVAMSVSSSLHEIKENRPDISAKEIFRSGINIGRDMIGTMSNTLILAYAGGSLGLVMIIYAYSYQMHQILNMYSVAIEIMRGISGTMGIILTVPITSLIMSVLLTDKHKEK